MRPVVPSRGAQRRSRRIPRGARRGGLPAGAARDPSPSLRGASLRSLRVLGSSTAHWAAECLRSLERTKGIWPAVCRFRFSGGRAIDLAQTRYMRLFFVPKAPSSRSSPQKATSWNYPQTAATAYLEFVPGGSRIRRRTIVAMRQVDDGSTADPARDVHFLPRCCVSARPAPRPRAVSPGRVLSVDLGPSGNATLRDEVHGKGLVRRRTETDRGPVVLSGGRCAQHEKGGTREDPSGYAK